MSCVVPRLAFVRKCHLRVIILLRLLINLLNHAVPVPVLREIEHAVGLGRVRQLDHFILVLQVLIKMYLQGVDASLVVLLEGGGG